MKSGIYLIFILLILSCSKNKDTTPPTLRLISPKENDTLNAQKSEYNIEFEANDETSLFKEYLKIIDEQGNILTTEERSIYGSNYSYSNTFNFGGTSGKIKKLFLIISIEDSGYNKIEKSIPFSVKL